jgi:5-methylcytosine-specific restriction enzyme subunit McrC
MARLYEQFVAEWLNINLPNHLILKVQERVNVDETLHFKIDLVLYDADTKKARYVLDTKYKIPDRPSSDDLAKIIAYAKSKGCDRAALVYPSQLKHLVDTSIDDLRVRSLTFGLERNLNEAGQNFLQYLLK